MKTLVIIIVVVLVVLFLAKDFIAGAFLTFGVSSFTDLYAGVQKVSVGVFKSAVDVKEFKLYNPKTDFKERVMMDMPELYIDYDLGSFLTGTKHLEKVKLNLKEFIVVKNEDGKLNLDSLKPIQKEGKAAGKKQDFKFKIDVLELKIDKVVYKDYSSPGGPAVKEYNVAINERYTNITDPYSFASLVVFKALAKTRIASLTNFDLGSLKDAASDALSKITGGTVENALDAVTKTGEKIKELLPFGK